MRARGALLATLAVLAAACGGGAGPTSPGSAASVTTSPSPAGPPGPGRGFPETAPWVSFYGTASSVDLARMAATFRILNIEADPDVGAFDPAQIAQLKGGGRNRVIGYLNVGSCESFRSYWSAAPGYVPCGANAAAQLGPYGGYADEVWMNPAQPDYQRLIIGYVAPRLVAQGVDGFFLDNLEVVEHGTDTANGPCDAACAQGGLDLVRQLRTAFPQHLIVMQNATSDRTRSGTTGGLAFPTLLDGISHEEVYAPQYDPEAERQLQSWRDLGLRPGGHPFFVATEDYVGGCDAVAAAQRVYAASRAQGFSPYATDASAGQQGVCYWPF